MSKKSLTLAACATATLALSIPASAETACTASRVMFLLDQSSSMNNPLENGSGAGQTKWEVATGALDQLTSTYNDSMELGLTLFPSQAGECNVGSAAVEPRLGARNDIANALLQPPPDVGNWTPMSQALAAVGDADSMNQDSNPTYVVLITDGWQWCDPYDSATAFAPVDSVTALNDKGITTFVVGFGSGVHSDMLNQAAVAAGTHRAGCDITGEDDTNRCYYQADTPADLNAALTEIAALIPAGETCDGLDNDCDGEADEDLSMECATACGPGVRICTEGGYGDCSAPEPEYEICDGIDNDCDGQADEAPEGLEGLCGINGSCVDGECLGATPAPTAGCGCDASGEGAGGRAATFFMAAALVLIAVGRRRRAGGLA